MAFQWYERESGCAWQPCNENAAQAWLNRVHDPESNEYLRDRDLQCDIRDRYIIWTHSYSKRALWKQGNAWTQERDQLQCAWESSVTGQSPAAQDEEPREVP